MAKKRESPKLIKIKDAIKLINQQVSLIGIVLEQREPKQCRNNDWICTLRIIDDTYPSPGLTVNVFSKTLEQLPQIKNHDDMILFTRIKMQTFDSGERVNAACSRWVSSFALFEGVDFVCYQCSTNFHEEEALYKSAMDDLRKVFAGCSQVIKAMQSISYRTKPCSEVFSFLREIKIGKRFDLVCRILHADEDTSAVFVWDGTDAPPASILAKRSEEDKAFSSLSVHTLLSRDVLLSFPTVGTILRVHLSSHLFYRVKPGDWVKLYHLLCEVDRGSWVIKVTSSTKVHHLAQDDRLVEKIMRIYDKRLSSKLGHISFWCFPSPPGLTETDDNCAPFVTLMDIITFPKVTCKYRCIVRVVAAYPWQVEDFCSDENRRHHQVLLTLEDSTATLEAFLCNKDAEYFWGLGFQDTETLRKKRNWLLGIRESSNFVAPRNPPWIECCILSYYTNKADPWNTRLYRIFGTRLLH
ncbi:Nucleic acid-binding, OB-fold-like protein [Arabidopsis thaliana]|uniref:Protection of telomeres protein 1a n=1 Tax=Arabidopsis thaliana TaxID=3702 RepID=POT1A_ARATH|nr:Nucleic acid-binding, OB-fold-like protein [Arabidopsis thaliana]NP_001118271.1 Nucleic acid-binding, OB-fold-like protein [Arabidopsis thaliana]NP_178592.3 Nucleic acid-binding, OB-fold-like protein [Arabidopsis thaliana]Q56Y52.1 RecName: Full=Protection of telomeres protein 1a; Short=AtPOT1a; Short=AtPot1; AltName: Full=Protection of telomeres protein 1 [Arabidopsis thaliana]AAX78213.2 protection of telomeres 1 protein [Arabidopsis thaliana]AEC05904.1 Nucleic acid-binding, OB-fold-like pr|eukprot:NP_001118270.1 Nucleic acid-binding, OB-fold-like protein [Arabidopsis thaliana]